jgi:hypothetical protein
MSYITNRSYLVSLFYGDPQIVTGLLGIELFLLNTLTDLENPPHSISRLENWSGYFCELDAAYPKQIIDRHVYGL